MLEFILKPWHLIVLFLASQLGREQQRVIEYLQVENEVLREKLGKKRILLNLKPAVERGAEAQLIQPSGLTQKPQLTHRVSLRFCASPSS